SGQDRQRKAPSPGAGPAPTAADGGVRGVRRPGRWAERQAARCGLLGERRSLAGYGASGVRRARRGGEGRRRNAGGGGALRGPCLRGGPGGGREGGGRAGGGGARGNP